MFFQMVRTGPKCMLQLSQSAEEECSCAETETYFVSGLEVT
jgi:hypothetical protein